MLEERHGTFDAIDIMTFDLYLVPGWQTIGEAGIACTYDETIESISARTIGYDFFDASIKHELFSHRAPHVLTGQVNRQHSLYWTQYEKQMTDAARSAYRGPP